MAEPSALSTRIGPFPLVAWAGIAAAGLAIGLVVKRRAGQPATAPATTDPGTVWQPPATTGPTTPGGGGGGGGGQDPAPTDNTTWGRQAVRILIGLGFDPLVAQQAIENFLTGQPLTTQQAAMVSQAIASLGAPPTDVPPAQTPPTPAPTPSPTPSPVPPAPPLSPRVSPPWTGGPPVNPPPGTDPNTTPPFGPYITLPGATLGSLAVAGYGRKDVWPYIKAASQKHGAILAGADDVIPAGSQIWFPHTPYYRLP